MTSKKQNKKLKKRFELKGMDEENEGAFIGFSVGTMFINITGAIMGSKLLMSASAVFFGVIILFFIISLILRTKVYWEEVKDEAKI